MNADDNRVSIPREFYSLSRFVDDDHIVKRLRVLFNPCRALHRLHVTARTTPASASAPRAAVIAVPRVYLRPAIRTEDA